MVEPNIRSLSQVNSSSSIKTVEQLKQQQTLNDTAESSGNWIFLLPPRFCYFLALVFDSRYEIHILLTHPVVSRLNVSKYNQGSSFNINEGYPNSKKAELEMSRKYVFFLVPLLERWNNIFVESSSVSRVIKYIIEYSNVRWIFIQHSWESQVV